MDLETLGIAAAVILFLGFFAYLLRDQMIQAKARREALERMARQRFWRIERQGARRGRGRNSAGRIIITPTQEADEEGLTGQWRLELVQAFQERGRRDHHNSGDALLHADTPRLPGAMLALAAPTPSLFSGGESKRLIGDLELMLGDGARERITALTPRQLPEAQALTVLANGEPANGLPDGLPDGFDLAAIARILRNWDPTYWLTPAPVLSIGADGMRLFVGGGLDSPEAISAFTRMASALQKAARGEA